MREVNLLGQRVATRVDEENAPGAHAVTWDCANYPGGEYFCRIATTEPVAIRTMAFVK